MADILQKASRTGGAMMSDTADFADGEVGAVHGITWGAVIAGALTGLVAQLVLSLFGIGVGLSAAPGVESFSIGAGIWIIASAIASYAIGGFISGRLGGNTARSIAGFQGLVTWALTTLVLVVMMTSLVGSVVGGTFGALSGAFGGAGGAISGAVKTVGPAVSGSADPMAAIVDQIKSAAGDPDATAAGNDALDAVKSALSSDPAQRDQATDQAARALAKAKTIPVAQARDQVVQYEQQYSRVTAQAKQTAAKVAEGAKTTATAGSLVLSISLILGAIAAFFAARLGTIGLASRLVGAD